MMLWNLMRSLMNLGRVLRVSWVRVCEGRVDQTGFTTSLWRVLPGWRGLGAPICCLPVAGNGLRRPPLRSWARRCCSQHGVEFLPQI
jgi:hypothetical protein